MSDTILNSFRSRDSFGGSGRRDLAGLSLDDILGSRDPEPPKKKDPEPHKKKDPEPPKKPVLQYSTSHITRTLLDVIREEEPNSGGSYAQHGGDNNKAWKGFKDRLRLRGTNQTWTASQPVPTSDEPIKTYRGRNKSLNRSDPEMTDGDEESKPEEGQVCDVPTRTCKPVMMRRGSVRFNPDAVEPEDPAAPVLKPSFSRRESARQASRTGSSRFLARSESVAQRDDDLLSVEDRHLGRRGSSLRGGEDRPMSAREAAASQEAAEAEAAASAAAAEAAAKEAEEAEPGFEDRKENEWGAEAAEEEKEPAAMFSLMDLLEQTDKQMGWEGSRYMDEEDEDYEDEEDEEEDEYSGHERNCSICNVKHREVPLAPCGHAYCKMCSRELYVSRSNCPVCNDFIDEIIDVF